MTNIYTLTVRRAPCYSSFLLFSRDGSATFPSTKDRLRYMTKDAALSLEWEWSVLVESGPRLFQKVPSRDEVGCGAFRASIHPPSKSRSPEKLPNSTNSPEWRKKSASTFRAYSLSRSALLPRHWPVRALKPLLCRLKNGGALASSWGYRRRVAGIY